MPSLTEIEDYLRTTRQEDPVPVKSQDRVRRDIAIGIKNNKSPDSGKCNFCGKEADKLFPTIMSVCKGCIERIIKKGGDITIIQINRPVSKYCDKCFGYSFEEFRINPRLCEYCSRRLGRFHKFNLQDHKKQYKKDKIKLGKKLNIKNKLKKELLKGGPK